MGGLDWMWVWVFVLPVAMRLLQHGINAVEWWHLNLRENRERAAIDRVPELLRWHDIWFDTVMETHDYVMAVAQADMDRFLPTRMLLEDAWEDATKFEMTPQGSVILPSTLSERMILSASIYGDRAITSRHGVTMIDPSWQQYSEQMLQLQVDMALQRLGRSYESRFPRPKMQEIGRSEDPPLEDRIDVGPAWQ